MVLLKHFLAAAALLASAVIADEPKTDAEAAEWFGQLDTITVLDVPVLEERASEVLLEERGKSDDDNDRKGRYWPKSRKQDPYRGRQCPRRLNIDFPRRTSCNRNSCFNSFLNTRDGSAGRHCPDEAFGFCCIWLSAGDYARQWAIRTDYLFNRVPYTRDCGGRRESVRDIVRNIDDVCGCTVGNRVSVENDAEYYRLRGTRAGESICRRNRGRNN